MRQNLLETYGRQLKVAEAYVSRNFDRQMSSNTALTTAVLLDNTNRFMTESLDFGIGQASQRSDLGAWRKFCLNLTNIAVPSLIANDLVIVHPMTSYSGSIAYLEYVSGQTKDGMKAGSVLNSVFGLGDTSEARTNYTSEVIVETLSDDAGTFNPVADIQKGAISFLPAGVKHDDYNIGVKTADIKVVHKDGKVEYGVYAGASLKNVETDAVITLVKGDKVAYKSEEFQMNHVPATKIPSIRPVMRHLPLVAEPRRIAVQYDQITAYQA